MALQALDGSDFAEAHDPESKSSCWVFSNYTFSIDCAPPLPVPPDSFCFAATGGIAGGELMPNSLDIPPKYMRTRIAMELLRRYLEIGIPCDAEELTLP